MKSTMDLDCIHNPIPENYAHSLITSKTGKISESKSKAMARNAAIVISTWKRAAIYKHFS